MSNDTKIRYFEGVAAGIIDAPKTNVTPDFLLFKEDCSTTEFAKCHYDLKGVFDKHYWASIPYALEQECRLGAGLLRFALKYKPLTLWCMNMAEATLSRSLSKLGRGRVVSLANTTNAINEHSFYAHGNPAHAYLKILSDNTIIEQLDNITPNIFINGFDVIIEDTSFQMKSSDRSSQIYNAKKALRRNGILIMTEKFLGDDYLYWENKKDVCFKTRFFSKSEIENKQIQVLEKMVNNQVSILDIKQAASKLFSYGVIFWNSGNFYSIAVCDDESVLSEFISTMIPPCIPQEFTRGDELLLLFGLNKINLSYRTPE